MVHQESSTKSPLKILHDSLEGGLGKGNLGVVMAPAGVGKTACLIQIGLDDLLSDKEIFHVAIGQSVEQVNAWYDALFDDAADRLQIADKDGLRSQISRRRVIKIFAENGFDAPRLREALELFSKHMDLTPQTILIDGFGWGDSSAELIPALKTLAAELNAELWMTATMPRGYQSIPESGVTPPCDRCASQVDVTLRLEPKGSHVAVYLVKDHAKVNHDAEPILQLHPETMRLKSGSEHTPAPKLLASNFTLLSGGANGAEAEFGACAERWGLTEANYSFQGRGAVRSRGLIELSEEELKLGDVSSAYLKAHMHRSYPDTPLFRRVLQSIWHQVNTAGEVFHIGQLQADNTARGGTGWAVELAKHWGKPVFVFDQDRHTWFTWKDHEWVEIPTPSITRDRFTGTGTRFLNDAGKQAIQQLFENSFGQTAR
ncbi:MAG: ATP-binding protein [Myxococcales bacterium]|jgi:hypothetical protein|nr:ATP-binding protein [Myxococcales bacterium]